MLAICFLIFGTSSAQTSYSHKMKADQTKPVVEVLYFFGKQRCLTCRAIENLTKEVINNSFASEIRKGQIRFKEIDISTREGEKIADKYEVTWSSLFVNQWKGKKEKRNNLTEFAFSNARNHPDTFKAGLKSKITGLLK